MQIEQILANLKLSPAPPEVRIVIFVVCFCLGNNTEIFVFTNFIIMCLKTHDNEILFTICSPVGASSSNYGLVLYSSLLFVVYQRSAGVGLAGQGRDPTPSRVFQVALTPPSTYLKVQSFKTGHDKYNKPPWTMIWLLHGRARLERARRGGRGRNPDWAKWALKYPSSYALDRTSLSVLSLTLVLTTMTPWKVCLFWQGNSVIQWINSLKDRGPLLHGVV